MRAWLSLLLDYFARWWKHLGEGRPVWIAIGVPFTVASFMWLVCWLLALNGEQYLRYVGGLLEFAGICTVALGLRDTRTLFKRPTFRRAVLDWVGRIPHWRQQHRVHVGTGGISLQPMAAQAYGSAVAPPDATIQQRISALESELKNLSGRIQAAREEFTDAIAQQKDALDREQRERKEQVDSTHRLIDEAVAGGLVLEATGLVWLLMGLALATASAELARLFS